MAKFYNWDDTITALATPQGIGAIGIIRVSGDKAFKIVSNIFPSKNITNLGSHTLHVGYLKYEETILDEVVLSIFKNPHSYTGEDVIEISCHGSNYIQEKILIALVKCGARLAKPGEFTFRAFINGKINLTQAEAVADLIASNTEASSRTALQHIRGGFSNILTQLRDQLLKFSALIELELDFAEEDVEFADRKQLYELLYNIESKVQQLLQSFKLGNVIKNGVHVAIIGKPNAGKSTLLNTLLNEERSIVSDIPGTTRDTIEETININGVIFRLIDTAGIRKNSMDVIENMGVKKSMEKIQQADIVLYLFDALETTKTDLLQTISDFKNEKDKIIFIANKEDILLEEEKEKYHTLAPVIFISAKHNRNIESVKGKLYSMAVSEQIMSNETIITNSRHIEILNKIFESIQEIIQGLNKNLSGDLLAIEIRRCLNFLGEITGEITNEEQLDFIFSKFCIGK